MQLFTCLFAPSLLLFYTVIFENPHRNEIMLLFCQHPGFFYLLEEFNNNNRIAADNFYYSRDLVTHKFARISAQEKRKKDNKYYRP